MADSHIKSLSRGMYRFYTIVTNHNGSLEAVDCDIHSVRYDMGRSSPCGHPNWASSGHLRRCSMADSDIIKFLSFQEDFAVFGWLVLLQRLSIHFMCICVLYLLADTIFYGLKLILLHYVTIHVVKRFIKRESIQKFESSATPSLNCVLWPWL